ncbi:MAG: NAD(P)/FAD-dependent oxidoreductase [Nitrososphaeria archaeon]
MDKFDVTIVGGGFSGLLCAKELSAKNLSVKVIEEHNEIGYPNKCSGVISSKTMQLLNFPFSKNIVENRFSKILFYSPESIKISLDFKENEIFVLNRYNLDNYLAEEAIKNGAEISILSKVTSFLQNDTEVKIKVNDNQIITSNYLVDARGANYYTDKMGLYNGVQAYAFYRDFDPDAIHVFFDKTIAPGFFAWLIPINERLAKVGLASKSNSFELIKAFFKRIGIKNYIKINFSPIVIGGVKENLVKDKILFVGDSAGQTKPTTGGGIYFGGMGSILLANALYNKILNPSISLVEAYERSWFLNFDKEIKLMKFVRSIFENMDNNGLEKLFSIAKDVLSNTTILNIDYDLHISSILKSIGIKNALKISGKVFGRTVTMILKSLITG